MWQSKAIWVFLTVLSSFNDAFSWWIEEMNEEKMAVKLNEISEYSSVKSESPISFSFSTTSKEDEYTAYEMMLESLDLSSANPPENVQTGLSIRHSENFITDFEPAERSADFSPPFRIFWNVPSKECNSFNISLELEKYGFTVNSEENFVGDKIVLMYSPGIFPRLLENGTAINGGIPQLGDLSLHLAKLREDIQRDMPDEEFDGVAVIDMESWEPHFEYAQLPYKQLSWAEVQRQHPNWSQNMTEELAREDFDFWARAFLQFSLQEGKLLRPRAQWGYYQYPLCKNLAAKDGTCPKAVQESNDRLQWLLGESTALYPSLYLFLHGYTDQDRYRMVQGRLDEALRLAGGTPSYPYTWFQYHDDDKFLSTVDLHTMLGGPKQRGLPGAVMWGATDDCNTQQRCQSLQTYLDTTLGPLVQQLTAV